MTPAPMSSLPTDGIATSLLGGAATPRLSVFLGPGAFIQVRP